MDIIEGILTDKELKYFNEEAYAALADVVDVTLCESIYDYVNSPDADPSIVANLYKYLKTKIDSYEVEKYVRDNNILAYIDTLSPETMALQPMDYQTIIDKLDFLADNHSSILSVTVPRTKAMYTRFIKAVKEVLNDMSKAKVSPTYNNVIGRINANSFIFYVPGEKSRTTPVAKVGRTRRKWIVALNGAKYLKMCTERNIDVADRRKFSE